MTVRRRRSLVAALAAVGLALLAPALVSAHPLGNFTINHYAGIRVEPDAIHLDIVIDQAEIPAFQARLGFDTDGDGDVSDAEIEAGRVSACTDLQPSLALVVDGTQRKLTLTEAGLRFPPGVGGLVTMRMVCGFVVPLDPALAAGARVQFTDTSFPDRLGWREIVSTGSGVTLAATTGELRTTSSSARLTAYPTNLLTQALADHAIDLTVTPAGPTLATFDIPDADPVPGAPVAAVTASPGASMTPAVVAGLAAGPSASASVVGSVGAAGAVPGGVTSGDLPSIFRTADVTPLVLIVSLLTAVALGAGHALTPGHGKTLMAAYLVGTKGTPLHAAGLGLSVTLSHTVGILILAALVVGAQGVLPPDLVVKGAPVVAAISILAIGGWMLFGEARRRIRRREIARAQAAEHAEVHAAGLAHDHAHEHEHDHDDHHEHGHDHVALDDHDQAPVAGEHSHGGVRHSHLPPTGSTITWRSLFVLGLAGGLIPSTSALLILLGSIAAGRPAFGFVLVVAFGLGMALVMGGIGMALVYARGRLDRVDAGSPLGRFGAVVPLAAACLVTALGVYLTFQAVAGGTTF